MKTDSSILLGTGGDNSTSGVGEFFEGAMTAGYPSDATENAVQADHHRGRLRRQRLHRRHATGAARRERGQVPGRARTPRPTNGTQTADLGLQRRRQPELDPTGSKQLTVYWQQVPGRLRPGHGQRHQGRSSGTCNGQTNQQWNVNADGTITSVQSGLCLDVTGAATANGTAVELWACNGGTNQQWSLS